jgi:V/A-type H+-transporting ATPase subunit B
MSLVAREYQTINYISGPLVFVEGAKQLSYNAMVKLELPDGRVRNGQVLEVSEEHAVIQVLELTSDLDVKETKVRLEEEVARLGVSVDMIGRVFNGRGVPIDDKPAIIPEKRLPITGAPINPVSRNVPDDFIQTGLSTIDGFNTLVRGQKLPIFSGSGLPHNEMAGQILRQAQVLGGESFVIIFAAMGITQREASFFVQSFEESGATSRVVSFINLADDPTVERILTPRMALTTAEFFAYEKDMQVLVILTDITNYCEALREIATAREEIPGRRGYPGYMYTDLATIYERAGRVHGRKGSVTQIPILSMPDDDITHPIADLTGYITEGQLVLSRQLHRLGVFPPMDVLPSLSRLMNNGIGEGKTRDDHRALANQLYAAYARGRDVRKLKDIVGEDSLSDLDKKYLAFADAFEGRMVGQGDENRNILETLGLGWELLRSIPVSELRRVNRQQIEQYMHADEDSADAGTEAEPVSAGEPGGLHGAEIPS